jgi:hypothetical protein
MLPIYLRLELAAAWLAVSPPVVVAAPLPETGRLR